MRRYEAQAPAWAPVTAPARALQPGEELERERPARPADLVADLLVPVGQAVISGALGGGLVAFLAARLGLADWPALWLGLGLGIAAVVWAALLGQTRRLLWSAERLTGRDLDRDGATGKPAERLIVVNAGAAREDAAAGAAEARRSQFARFVADLPERGTDARTWEPELGRETYREYRDTLIRLGWARWRGRGTRNGWELARPAAWILDRVSG